MMTVMPQVLMGSGSLDQLGAALHRLRCRKPLLMSDEGLKSAGILSQVETAAGPNIVVFTDIPPNPTAAAADGAYEAYLLAGCDSVIAVGGGSVIDTAKIVVARTDSNAVSAMELLGRPELIGPHVVPLVVLPTTVGTGSESSPATGLHPTATTRTVGTRSTHLVPKVAILDPNLVRTLPPKLVAATGIDALSHCIEGYFAEPAHPLIDALALDGITRAFTHVEKAVSLDGDSHRGDLMTAAFAGGMAIHKGLGPAHAIALACGDQNLHHGVLVSVALPFTVELVSRHAPEKADRVRAAMGLAQVSDISSALRALCDRLGLPENLSDAGYLPASLNDLVEAAVNSPFNRTSPYIPSVADYRNLFHRLLP